jgi:hypothetical protein
MKMDSAMHAMQMKRLRAVRDRIRENRKKGWKIRKGERLM